MKATSPFVVKVDSHITLKIRVKSDSIPLFNLVKKNKKHLIKWMPWIKTTKKLVDTEKFINNNLEKFKKGEACDMGVFYDGEMIGSAGYNKINTINKSGEIGYWISKDYEGKGIMTKVVKKLIQLGKEKYKLHRIVIKMILENKRSQAVPKRLGFRLEGVLRDDSLINGKFHSSEVWSLLIK
mgnify:CR=1 FL=1